MRILPLQIQYNRSKRMCQEETRDKCFVCLGVWSSRGSQKTNPTNFFVRLNLDRNRENEKERVMMYLEKQCIRVKAGVHSQNRMDWGAIPSPSCKQVSFL